jgi:hypothetical protein
MAVLNVNKLLTALLWDQMPVRDWLVTVDKFSGLGQAGINP